MHHASKIFKERSMRRRKVVDSLTRYSHILRKTLGKVTVVLYGSYARGDFNIWSDIDVIVVSNAFRNTKFTKRWELLPEPPEELKPIDIIAWTPDEAKILMQKPSWRKALNHSIIIIDDYRLLEETQHPTE